MITGLILFYALPAGQAIFSNLHKNQNSNFNLLYNSSIMQFYPNMRYPTPNISYEISKNCSLTKITDMKKAFFLLDNETILSFYPVMENPEINIYCQNKIPVNGSYYVAGEGGPTNVTDSQYFRVITHGEVLLIKSPMCPTPNVETHELLHALGFKHSKNKNNIMYPISECSQSIGNDTIQFLDKIYSVPSEPDLAFLNASAKLSGRYLDINFSIQNEGLAPSKNSTVKIYTDSKLVKEIPLSPIDLGSTLSVKITNIWLSKITFNQIKINIESPYAELSDSNNEINLSKN